MTENQIERAGGIRGTRRWRYLVDIVALVAVTFLLDALLEAFIPAPISLQKGLFVFDAIGKMLLVGVAWGLIRLGEGKWGRVSTFDIGLSTSLGNVVRISPAGIEPTSKV